MWIAVPFGIVKPPISVVFTQRRKRLQIEAEPSDLRHLRHTVSMCTHSRCMAMYFDTGTQTHFGIPFLVIRMSLPVFTV